MSRRQNPAEEGEEPRGNQEEPQSLPPKGWSVFLWWVLANAIGAAAGGATHIIAFLGLFLMFGPLIGAAQAWVLGRYLRNLCPGGGIGYRASGASPMIG